VHIAVNNHRFGDVAIRSRAEHDTVNGMNRPHGFVIDDGLLYIGRKPNHRQGLFIFLDVIKVIVEA